MIQAPLTGRADDEANQKGFWGMLEEIGSPLLLPAGQTHDALLSTIVAFLVKRSDAAQPSEVALATEIIRSLIPKASPETVADTCRQLEAVGLRLSSLVPPSPAPVGMAAMNTSPDLDDFSRRDETPNLARENVAFAVGDKSLANAVAIDPVAEAATCGPGRLVMLAQLPDVPEALSNRIVARGHAEALVAVLSNPSARFAKSSLTTIVELAASDFSLRQALCKRGDLPDAILDRLWPFLSQASRVNVLTAGCGTELRALTALLAEADQDLIMAVREGELPLSIDTCLARIKAGEWTLARAIKALGQEGRIADVATLLARLAAILPVTALGLLMGAYDRGLVVLASAAQADVEALEAALVVRTRAGCRRTADGRGPLHALAALPTVEAGTLLLHLVAGMEAAQARTAALLDMAKETPPQHEQTAAMAA
jgi:hypothetical protein